MVIFHSYVSLPGVSFQGFLQSAHVLDASNAPGPKLGAEARARAPSRPWWWGWWHWAPHPLWLGGSWLVIVFFFLIVLRWMDYTRYKKATCNTKSNWRVFLISSGDLEDVTWSSWGLSSGAQPRVFRTYYTSTTIKGLLTICLYLELWSGLVKLDLRFAVDCNGGC